MKKLLTISAVVLISLLVWLKWEVWVRAPAKNATAIAVVVPEGSSARRIGSLLKDKGLVDSTLLFRAYVAVTGNGGRLRSGQYELRDGSSVSVIVKTLTGVGGYGDVTVTFIEGWDLSEIATALQDKLGIPPEDFYAVAGRPPRAGPSPLPSPAGRGSKTSPLPLGEGKGEGLLSNFQFLKNLPPSSTLEGYLFPDTYRFRPGATAEEVVRRMLDNFSKKVTQQITPKITPENYHRTITIASLLEAEVQKEDDMRRVADIIKRRLDAGWGLQIDATLNYITGKKSPSASSADIKLDSPYNTYKYRGLPPGPINNPGLKAIRTAQNPLLNNYWYYLTGKDGTVHYARTLQEHKKNRKYL